MSRTIDLGPSPHGDSFWRNDAKKLLAKLRSGMNGLPETEASHRLLVDGPNLFVPKTRRSLAVRFMHRLLNPLVLILIVAAAISGLSADTGSFAVILGVISLSLTLDIVQEHRAELAADALRRSVAIRADVLRGGACLTVPVAEIVPGDIVMLRMGDLVPADGVVLDQKGLQTDESLLTGEAFPVPKSTEPCCSDNPTEAENALFAGTSVVAGRGSMLVVHTGSDTRFGAIAAAIDAEAAPTALEEGVRRLGFLIVRLTVFLTLFVLFAHLIAGHQALPSFLFAVALAVGLTPELLPMIMTVTLSRGARRMASQKVIVKRLSSIHDLGAMDVLCVDKTGTLTEARITLTGHVDCNNSPSERVLHLAAVNSRLQTGMRSPLDDAVARFEATAPEAGWTLDGEIPFDFSRRCLSVAATRGGTTLLVTKGAPEAVIAKSVAVEVDGLASPLDEAWKGRLDEIQRNYQQNGLRLLGVAIREIQPRKSPQLDDETGLTFVGFCIFSDPVKSDAAGAVAELASLGIGLKIISGDQASVVQHVAAAIGVPSNVAAVGSEIENLSDEALAALVGRVDLFARVDPDQKKRIIVALRRNGHIVGFVGDGVNDAPAIHAAHVGLSVDGATEVARAAADIILLSPSLNMLAAGVREGRRTLANIMKYVRMGTSSNFGNMLSMAMASVALPFLPLLPLQILLNNLLYDLSEVGIPFDDVEIEDIKAPRTWDMHAILRFTMVMGALSSVFDIATFATLLLGFEANEDIFRTGWFLESIATQILVIFLIRSSRPPWRAIRPNMILVVTSLGALTLACALPFGPLQETFGFVGLPWRITATIACLTIGYLVAAEYVKHWATGAGRRPL